MKHLRTSHLALLVGMVALQGCFDSSPNSSSEDVAVEEEAIQSVIFEDEGELTSTDIRYYQDEADGPAGAPINTVRWRRQLLDLDRSVSIEIHDPSGEIPTADVAIRAHATGLLHLLVNDGDTLRRVAKDFEDGGVRSLFFQRSRESANADDRRFHRGWKLVALSGVAIRSPGTTRAIHSVRLQAGDVDRTFQNMTDLVRVGDIAIIEPATLVRVTVDTGDATDHVFLHRRHMRSRIEFTNNGDGTFTATFETDAHQGPRHFAVDVLSDGTLYDDEAPYDNVVWGIPYRVIASSDVAG
ncbi:hypothetical protein K8I85_17885 [bacterium]|nr:hypothetical protein [bacterium]